MKYFILNVIWLLVKTYHQTLFLLTLKNKGDVATIFDIDNTLTHSRLYQKNGIKHGKFPINATMKNIVLEADNQSDVFFISARSFLLWRTTIKWLRENFRGMLIQFFLVRRMEDKWFYIYQISNRYNKIIIYEDFSYGTLEDVKINVDFRNKVTQLPNVQVFDWKFLESLHNEILT